MTSFVALLRAVNVGGTGKLAMRDLEALCRAAGLDDVRTYIASGKVVFRSDCSEAEVKAAIEAGLLAIAGKKVGVLVRTAAEMVGVVAGNPFRDAPGNRVTAIFLDGPPSQAVLDCAVGRASNEELALGKRGNLRALRIWHGDHEAPDFGRRHRDGAQHEHRLPAGLDGGRRTGGPHSVKAAG